MAKKLRVVHVEDNPADADLMARALREAGYDVDWQRVETEDELRRTLQSTPDLVIADYHLPRFTGPRALELLRQTHRPHRLASPCLARRR